MSGYRSHKSHRRDPTSQYTLKVTNLSLNVTQKEMEDVCRSCADYRSLKVNKGHAFVNFSSLEGAVTAMAFLKKVQFSGQCPIVKLQDKDSIATPPPTRVYTPPPASISQFHPVPVPAHIHNPPPSALSLSPDISPSAHARIPPPAQTCISSLARVPPRIPLSAPHSRVPPPIPLSVPHSHASPFPVYRSSHGHNRKSTAQSSIGESSTVKVTFSSSGITGISSIHVHSLIVITNSHQTLY